LKRGRQVHGLAGVKQATLANSDDQIQSVLVTDGEDGSVRLSLSTSSYPAILSPEDARWISEQLIASAIRQEHRRSGEERVSQLFGRMSERSGEERVK
jgi:hypothetical protein